MKKFERAKLIFLLYSNLKMYLKFLKILKICPLEQNFIQKFFKAHYQQNLTFWTAEQFVF